jgi:hypothetical protein
MKTLFLGISLLVIVTLVPSRAHLLADARSDYAGETVGSVMTPLTDTHGTGTWTYDLAQVNNASVPTGFSNLETLTYEANGDGGSAPYLYGTTNSNSSNIINLPSVSNGQLFTDSPAPAADFIGVHPSAGTNAGLVQWTAGAGETGTLSLTFDLSRLGVGNAGAGPTQGYVDFNIFQNSTPIFAADNLYVGTDTGPITELLANVTVGTKVSFVISSGNGVLGYNQAFLRADISAVPEPSTRALLLLGAGALVFVAARRRNLRA